MKKYMIIIFLVMVSGITSVTGGNLRAYLTYSTFYSPDGPYIETYLTIDANSVEYTKISNGKFQGTVNILMTFKQNSEIKAFKKYELKSPAIADTSKLDFHFIDQQRFLLPNGTYEFEVQLSDQNLKAEVTPYSQTVTINYPKDKPAISGIELIKSYTHSDTESEINKSGFDLVPYVYSFYPQTENKIIFYCELYNMNKQVGEGNKYLLNYYVETLENGQRVKDLEKVKKEMAKDVTVVLADLNIVNLPTGNYNLIVEARDQQNQIMASRKLFFQRSNPYAKLTIDDMATVNPINSFVERYTNIDTLREYVNSTYPISSALEKNFLKGNLQTATLPVLQQYFLGFWQRRDANNPEKAWMSYKYLIEIVEHNFGTPVKRGYQTDRGRVFLQYGAPNVRAERYNEPSNYPYEIWQYYTLTNQSNRKFVFYSPDMVTSDFFLLHSDAIGEIHNARWQVDLRSRMYQTIDITDTQVINSWGDMQEDYWTLPN